ncbi:hypothetical protein HX882_10150 [Pseudomonas gingeri]|uniref:Uncharacterized protein n=1 Tax=Pseudomonas gingeri TaxID=117681 RepID=A0A7Y7XCM1_9PSED|nr:hypothetical protein [Pseudomonas gingeri]NWB96252.1 hypothetical protein [Pseudomonas gingeri]
MSSSRQAPESRLESASGGKARSIAAWLGLAAAPTFIVMALLTAANARPDMACASMQGPFAFDGMVTMYLIMGAFHLPPWLRLFSGRASRSVG